MTYGGLRGAVSLAMALLLDMDNSVDVLTKDMVVFHTAGIVTLTIVINGTTAGALEHFRRRLVAGGRGGAERAVGRAGRAGRRAPKP